MTLAPPLSLRLQFLFRVVGKEGDHLAATDKRLFAESFTVVRAERLSTDLDLAERVEAFVSRFSRLQDTLGDKLLPVLLVALGERTGAAIDNLDRAEQLGLVRSVDEWLSMRHLRNQMIHEYVEDLAILTSALQSAHDFVPSLLATSSAFLTEAERRGWFPMHISFGK